MINTFAFLRTDSFKSLACRLLMMAHNVRDNEADYAQTIDGGDGLVAIYIGLAERVEGMGEQEALATADDLLCEGIEHTMYRRAIGKYDDYEADEAVAAYNQVRRELGLPEWDGYSPR